MQRAAALAIAVSLAGALDAQSFFEGFEPGPTPVGTAPVPAGWTSVNDSASGPGANPNWLVVNDGNPFSAFGGITYAFANFDSVFGANNISNYLISPPVTFNNGDTISFYTRTSDAPQYADRLRLVYNTTGSTLTADFTNVLLTINPTLTTTGYPSTWTQFSATISGLSGPTTGRFAFHYNPTNGGPFGLNSSFVGVDDVNYVSSAGTLASNTTIGAGCGATYDSVYQSFADAAVASAALQGNALRLIATPTGYVTNWLPGAAGALFVTPVAPAVLATFDDESVAVTPTAPLSTPYGPQAVLQVTGNGIIGFGAAAQDNPGTQPWIPTAAGFLNSANGGIYSWHDYNEFEGGDVLREEISGVLYITYNNVESYPFTPTVNPSTLQFQLHLASGNVTIVWSSIDTNTTSVDGSSHLVGVTAPGASLDPTPVVLSSGSFVTTTEAGALALAATNRPIQGVGPSNWNLSATNLPAGIGVDLVGTVDPGIPDLSLLGLGMPNCQLHATDITGAFLSGGTHTWAVLIPGGAPSLAGVELFTQTAVLDFSGNLALTKTTNGIKGLIGTF